MALLVGGEYICRALYRATKGCQITSVDPSQVIAITSCPLQQAAVTLCTKPFLAPVQMPSTKCRCLCQTYKSFLGFGELPPPTTPQESKFRRNPWRGPDPMWDTDGGGEVQLLPPKMGISFNPPLLNATRSCRGTAMPFLTCCWLLGHSYSWPVLGGSQSWSTHYTDVRCLTQSNLR